MYLKDKADFESGTISRDPNATQAFREKWGGVIHPDFSEGSMAVNPNAFVGTATQTDVVQALIQGGSSGNLIPFLTETGFEVNEIVTGDSVVPENIFKAQKHNDVRSVLSARETLLDSGMKLPDFDLRNVDISDWATSVNSIIHKNMAQTDNGVQQTIPVSQRENTLPNSSVNFVGQGDINPENAQNQDQGSPFNESITNTSVALGGGSAIAVGLLIYFLLKGRK